jgi:HTH-type transcriptional regulator/antitoxin HigA
MLRATLERLGWSQLDLARVMGRPAAPICEIATNKKRITADTARQLEAATGVEADAWMLCQARWDLKRAPATGLRGIRERAKRLAKDKAP